jgi:flavin reductase (DIM6/NTAB) family NADH-FMN oxidoreductase RutF
MTIRPEAFRDALARWASGVTIVTARNGDDVHGMTVSAFSSVSLDPPLVLVCADRSSNTHGVIRGGGVFSVNVLARGQEELSNLFADKKREDVRFDGLDCAEGATGCPRIPGAAWALDCRVSAELDAGDHVIYVGEVVDSAVSDLEPLVYYRGAYHTLA